MNTWQIITADCIEAMREMPDNSIDACVTDPPYELGFMGKRWDASGIANSVEMWSEALRVLKPGGHLLAFGGTRTYHRMVCAVEDAGFEVRDQIAWMFGSGFPKSLDVSKAIDKAAGAEREVVARDVTRFTATGRNERYGKLDGFDETADGYEIRERTAPATPEAAEWEGWGTALKPAFEPIVVARKPLIGTVAQNVLEHGTGALNIDATRVEFVDDNDLAAAATAAWRSTADQNANRTAYGDFNNGAASLEPYLKKMHKGRWPANVALDPEAGAMLDEQTSDLRGATSRTHRVDRSPFTSGAGESVSDEVYGDTGGASRFFFVTSENTLSSTEVGAKDSRLPIEHGGIDRFKYCAKTSRGERNAGLEGFEAKRPDRDTAHTDGRQWDIPGSRSTPRANVHPTVKPIALMRWLCRLVAPPGAVILDPFNGSGSTGCAAVLEGFNYIGIEREPEYVEIAKARIKWWAQHPEGVDMATRLKEERNRTEREATGQTPLFGEAA